METQKQYVDKNIQMCIDNNILYNALIHNFEQEWFELLIKYIKEGKKISQKIFNSLNGMQQYYINKHFIIQGIKIFE